MTGEEVKDWLDASAIARRLRGLSGLSLFGGYFLFVLVMAYSSPLLGGFSGAFVTAAGVAWLQFCTSEVVGCGRILTEKIIRWLAIPTLWTFCILIGPLLMHEPWKAAIGLHHNLMVAASVAFAISLLVVADNLAMAIAKTQIGRGPQWLAYGLSMLCFLPPAGMLFLHSRLMAVPKAALDRKR